MNKINYQKQILIFSPALILAILGTIFGIYWLINVDVAAQLEISRQLLDDKKLYQDIFETQFPAAYFIPVIATAISKWLNISAIDTFFGFTFILLNVRDLETNQPQLILIDNGVQKEWLGKMQFNFIQYFSKDPRFVKLWKIYAFYFFNNTQTLHTPPVN